MPEDAVSGSPVLGPAGRAAIYAGSCLALPPSAASERVVEAARQVVERAFLGPAETAHQRFDGPGFFAALTAARGILATDAELARSSLAMLEELGVSPNAFAMDRPRLRAVAPGGHRVAGTHAAYALHRDTWYANPRAQINLWVPLRAVSERDGLSLYPGALRTPLANDSESFDYAAFRRLGGFQSGRSDSPAAYPRLLGSPPAERTVPPLPRAGRLLFSAAQLHGPTPHDEAHTRFSVDVRVVSRLDHRLGRGAPRVDDRSRGDASAEYDFGGPPAGAPA
ncbi:MAG: hypothetical protein KC593_03955 [Myxococcales bacterium]|nr:hypothetical protein [Myxococcales bacterium]MCB9628505.1 hypothetical protein [Sandaracinaceae bacterium]